MSASPKSSLLLAEVFPPISGTPKTQRSAEPVMVAEARIPMMYWEERWVFRNIEDIVWRTVTAEPASEAETVFPTTLRRDHRSHPGYVLEEVGNYALRICPLTSRRQNTPYIPAGTILEKTGFRMDRDSFLVLSAVAVLPRRIKFFSRLPQFLGICPVCRLLGLPQKSCTASGVSGLTNVSHLDAS